ncbi:GGDEF domain-containing protein [Vibrio sp. WXL210]|uniref:GGDEF domain-containing protein n=1 Tax=Vibrio sp. WXL210 TaxID=3450709 RepID=UPI003EC81ED1
MGLFTTGAAQLAQQQEQRDKQSQRNLQIAHEVLAAQLNNAMSKLRLLEQASREPTHLQLATTALKKNIAFNDIILVDARQERYLSLATNTQYAMLDSNLRWHQVEDISEQFWVSSAYQTASGTWVFALRDGDSSNQQSFWIEFDLRYLAARLNALKPMASDSLFVVEKHTATIIIHPNMDLVGTSFDSDDADVQTLLSLDGETRNSLDFHPTALKVGDWYIDDHNGWVLLSGQKDQLMSNNLLPWALMILSLLCVVILLYQYLAKQLTDALEHIAQYQELNQFKGAVKSLFDRFTYHSGVSLCLFDTESQQFQTIDYHGNRHTVLVDRVLGEQLSQQPVTYSRRQRKDPLAKTLNLRRGHYVIPLRGDKGLSGVIYLQTRLPAPKVLLNMVQSYCAMALNRALLKAKVTNKDALTQLENKQTIRAQINQHLGQAQIYFALLDIDQLKQINATHGHLVGDKVIAHIAKLLQTCFTKPNALCLARYGGGQFCILFRACDEANAYEQCELLRLAVEQARVEAESTLVECQISIGISQIRDSQQTTINRADKALCQAKGLGRNQVVLNTFED